MSTSIPPTVRYHRLSIGGDGQTHMQPAEFGDFASRSLGGEAAPALIQDVPGDFQNVSFVILPVGWVGDWHESPCPQWVVALEGRWYIEPQDGQRVEMGPGELHWGADQNSRDVRGGRGHRSGQLGVGRCVLMMVQRDGAPPETA